MLVFHAFLQINIFIYVYIFIFIVKITLEITLVIHKSFVHSRRNKFKNKRQIAFWWKFEIKQLAIIPNCIYTHDCYLTVSISSMDSKKMFSQANMFSCPMFGDIDTRNLAGSQLPITKRLGYPAYLCGYNHWAVPNFVVIN